MTNRAAPRRDLRTAALVAGWLLAAAAGLFGLLRYGHAPGAAGLAPAAWPDDCGLAPAPDRPTLLLFAHPRCPCTVASVHELARLVADVGGAIGGHVLFTRPAGVEDDFTDTELRRDASRIPGFLVADDADGRLAVRFGASTSGHVVVYDPGGQLVFSGGITAARSHEGDNRGREAIRSFVRAGAAPLDRTEVFGCALRDDCCAGASGP